MRLTSANTGIAAQAMLSGNTLPASLSDWRPPHVIAYNVRKGVSTDVTPWSDPLLNATIGEQTNSGSAHGEASSSRRK